MLHKLTITIFADTTGNDRETWHALFSYRGEDCWVSLRATWVEEAEFEVAEMLASAPRLGTDPQPLRWSLAAGATQPMEGQVAALAVMEGFTLADVVCDLNRAAA